MTAEAYGMNSNLDLGVRPAPALQVAAYSLRLDRVHEVQIRGEHGGATPTNERPTQSPAQRRSRRNHSWRLGSAFEFTRKEARPGVSLTP